MQLDGSLVIHRRDIKEVNKDLRRHGFTSQETLDKMLFALEANIRSVNFVEDTEENPESPEAQDNENEDEIKNEGEFN